MLVSAPSYPTPRTAPPREGPPGRSPGAGLEFAGLRPLSPGRAEPAACSTAVMVAVPSGSEDSEDRRKGKGAELSARLLPAAPPPARPVISCGSEVFFPSTEFPGSASWVPGDACLPGSHVP